MIYDIGIRSNSYNSHAAIFTYYIIQKHIKSIPNFYQYLYQTP